jgi:transposase-like protein
MAGLSKQAVWAARMASWSRSGESRRAWCARHGINVHTFDYWRRRLRDFPVPRKRKARTSLVPIVVAAATAAEPLELVLPSGVRLRVPSGSDVAQAAQLVRALGAC